MSQANAWCNGRGGVAALLSRTNQPNDYSLQCGDGSQCKVEPGRSICATAAEIAANTAHEMATAEAEFQVRLPQWQADFTKR